jgi:hypothetical protein
VKRRLQDENEEEMKTPYVSEYEKGFARHGRHLRRLEKH